MFKGYVCVIAILHQTTTEERAQYDGLKLYLIEIPHQTTTYIEPPRPAGLPHPVCSRGSHTEPSAARRTRRGFGAQSVAPARRRTLRETAPVYLFHRQCSRAMEVTNPKGGRPRKSAATLRSRTVRFRVSEAEYLRVQRKAAACNLTLSEYARQAVVSGRIGTEELRLVSELTRELNNLNQLAFLQHAFGVASHEEELRRILRFYDEVIGRLKQKL